jgi:hypothetical protein
MLCSQAQPGLCRPHHYTHSWTPWEDQQLTEAVIQIGTKNWALVGATMQLVSRGECNRTGKQCRERWHNHLDPSLIHAPFSAEEDAQLIRLQQIFANKWTEISKRMPGRSDNAVKNRWNSCLSKVDTMEHAAGRKRSARSLSDLSQIVATRQPFKDSVHVNVEWGTTPTGIDQHAETAALPCAVRSIRRTPPDTDAKAESSGIIFNDWPMVTDFCFAEKCSSIAQYGFRASSGHVRRTRCRIHHEAGMYAFYSISSLSRHSLSEFLFHRVFDKTTEDPSMLTQEEVSYLTFARQGQMPKLNIYLY